MDTFSSGEDFLIKTRKPYTITKQRERWTDEEHNRFLDALKLYGRAWQRIEEHIGTKTAVQIRSHAQKFFTKLEKEALVKGVQVGQALDIDIPPPRPKRKPSNPFPRKTGLDSSQLGAKDGKCSPNSFFSTQKQVVNSEKESSPKKPEGDGNDTQNENDFSEVLDLFQGGPCSTSLSSANRNSRSPKMAPTNSCALRGFVPISKVNEDAGSKNTLNLEMTDVSLEKPFQSEKTGETEQPETCGKFSSNDMQAAYNYPRHVPVHVLNGSLGLDTQIVSFDMPYQETILNQVGGIHLAHHHHQPYLSCAEAAASTNTRNDDGSRSSSFSPYPLFDAFRSNQDNYQTYLQASSTISGLIVSSLLQNPAAHAAASFAAAFGPYSNIEACGNSPMGPATSGLSPPPSMAAIAAATVAAATAWWAAHGLLPICTSPPQPLHNGFRCNPNSSTIVNPPTLSTEKGENEFPLQNQQQQLEPECSEATQAQEQPALKLSTLTSSDSETSEGAKQNAGVNSAANNEEGTTATAAAAAAADPNKPKSMKQVDRSSCESNTPSGSEVETDAFKKKHDIEQAEEELKEEQPNDLFQSACDTNNRRGFKFPNNKEVSEEGRIAFKALFSREVLPQSFSSPNYMRNKGYHKKDNETDQQKSENQKVQNALELDLNSKMWQSYYSSHQPTTGDYMGMRSETNGKALLGTTEIGQGKLKARATGFKPYKRCSVEANECMAGSSSCNQVEEKSPKRIRLQGEVST